MHPVVVVLSARIVSWPPRCCCCNCPNPPGSYRAVYTRQTGIRVRRQRHWVEDVPCCYACLDHVRMMMDAYAARRSATSVAALAAVCLVPSLCVFPCCLLTSLARLADPHRPVDPSMAACWGLATLCGVMIGLLLVFLRFNYKAKERRLIDEAKDVSRTVGRCSCIDYPVVYRDLNGTLLTFAIYNHAYARGFIEANRKKVYRVD
jgi:hypothetical protein